MVEHLSKEKTGRFTKNISFFLRGSNEISGKVEVTGKRVNIGDGVEGDGGDSKNTLKR